MKREEYEPYVNVAALVKGLEEHPDTATDAELAPVISRLCQFYTHLKQAQPNQPAVFQPGGEWREYLNSLATHYAPFLNGDIPAATNLLRHFWRNELGAIVKQYAGHDKLSVSEEDRIRFTDWMARDYMLWKNLFHAPISELTVPNVGNPWGYIIDGVMIAPKVLRYHTLMTQIQNIVSDQKHPIIAEIGAGYGGTAHFLLRGTQARTYIDFDLPEMLLIAAYYLMRTLPHRKVLLWEPGLDLQAINLRDYSAIMCPNWAIQTLPSASVDLFLNTFSLSEMPLEVITSYIGIIEKACRGYFLYNNMDRAGVINRGHERVPCSQYPIAPDKFKMLYKRYDLFQELHSGRDGDYREVLLQRIGM